MILWCDGAYDVIENMRRDRALLDRLEAESDEAVLRLFCFDPPGITLGHAQRAERELDLDRCRADHVAWAVRPTGGRAIFHAEEWTYSVAARIDDPAWGGSLADSYARTAEWILASLARLGVSATLAGGARSGLAASTAGAARAGTAPPCFATAARHEIVLDGRKLVGSAQRRTAHALLQQGSVLLGPGHRRLVDYQRLPEAAREPARRALESAAAEATALAGLGIERWAEALAAVLPPNVRRRDAESGGFLLTPVEARPYTRRAS